MIATNRTKFWKELNQKEKIERMRQIIKNLEKTLTRIKNKLEKFEQVFINHSHHKNEVLIPLDKIKSINRSEMRGSINPINNDKVYF